MLLYKGECRIDCYCPILKTLGWPHARDSKLYERQLGKQSKHLCLCLLHCLVPAPFDSLFLPLLEPYYNAKQVLLFSSLYFLPENAVAHLKNLQWLVYVKQTVW